MSKLGIGTGITPDDGNGDSLLDGAVKVNSNFNEIYSYFGDGTNLSGSWQKVSSGINTTLSVGIGTTNPRFTLEVGAVGASGTSLYVNGNARITGILTVGSSSISLDGSNNILKVGSGVTVYGNTGIVSATSFYAGGLQVGVVNAGTIVYEGATLYNTWGKNDVGINTLSNVGIGTTNPTSALTVVGSGTSTSQLYVTGVSTFGAQVNVNTGGLSNLNIGFPNDLYLQWDESSQSASLDTSATGNLYVQNIANGGIFLNAGVSNKSGVHLYPSDRVELLHAGSKKFETAGAGVTVTGITSSTNLYLTNNAFISGIVTATAFVGDGSGLINLPGGAGGVSSQWISTSAGIHTLSNVGVGTTNPITPLQVENVYGIDTASGTFSPTAGSPYTANSWTISSTNFRTAEYTLWFQYTSGIQSQKILIMNNGTTAYYEEYGVMYSNTPIVSVGATIESGSVKLLWTPESGVNSGLVTFRYTRETML